MAGLDPAHPHPMVGDWGSRHDGVEHPVLFLTFGNRPIVILPLCGLLDFGCRPGIIRAKLHRLGGGTK